MKLIVTNKGPIDRHQPGDDVTGLYRAEVVTRLVKEGYLRRDYKDTDGDSEPEAIQELEVVDDESRPDAT